MKTLERLCEDVAERQVAAKTEERTMTMPGASQILCETKY